MSIWRWTDHIAPIPEDARITLGEGGTPLIRSRRIGPAAGLSNLFFKLETGNPTGSYKDRFAAAAVSDMAARGIRRCIATSSGNTGAALAAYCAVAGIRCQIAIVETAPAEKLRQMLAYGAELYRVKGFGTDPRTTAETFETLRDLAGEPDADFQISAFKYSPVGMSGVRSIGLEIAEQLPAVEHVFSPAGGGGLTLAVAQGLQAAQWSLQGPDSADSSAMLLRPHPNPLPQEREKEPDASGILQPRGDLTRDQRHPSPGGEGPRVRVVPPAVHCVQPAGNDTIATPLREGAEKARDVRCASRISGLQVANVIDGNEVIAACRASGGTGHAVEDEFIWRCQQRLAAEEGIFAEPAGATALAGALQAKENGDIADSNTIACLITGSGFKDAGSVQRMTDALPCPSVSLGELREAMKD